MFVTNKSTKIKVLNKRYLSSWNVMLFNKSKGS